MNNLAEKIEQFSFGLLIFLRNFSQLLRCFVLFKNQKEVKVIKILFRKTLKKSSIFLRFSKKKKNVLTVKSWLKKHL